MKVSHFIIMLSLLMLVLMHYFLSSAHTENRGEGVLWKKALSYT